MCPAIGRYSQASAFFWRKIKMKKIKLFGKNDKYALVDDEDFEELNKYNWYFTKSGYAERTPRKEKKREKIWMHRLVNKTLDGVHTDHINRNKLDNRKCNLRSCTKRENLLNRDKYKNCLSKYKGVTITYSNIFPFMSQISSNNKTIYLGRFKTELEAAIAYNEAAKKYHLNFACLNKI